MLISFSVGNYRSFNEEQSINLIASKRLRADDDSQQCVGIPGVDERLLSLGAIYGANGSGKSNLVKALRFVHRLVIDGTSLGKRIAFQPFRFALKNRSQPSSFALRFVAGGSVFSYGFCCDAETIQEEWLDIYQGTKERQIFSRVTEEGEVTIDLGHRKFIDGASKITALAEIGARPNQLFLTEILNLDDPKAQGHNLRSVVDWFTKTLVIIEPDSPFAYLAEYIAKDEAFTEFAGRFLHEADTGICNLEAQSEELPISALSTAGLEGLHERMAEGEFVVIRASDGSKYMIDGENKDTVQVTSIVALHTMKDGGTSYLPLSEESDGSQRLLNLLPALHMLRTKDAVFVIDELERSLHPMLARKVLEYFLKAVQSASRQLLFTTHETTLLDSDVLRRDAIWFTEKSDPGATTLYSLSEFKVRKDLRVAKHYLQGRFSAIPFLGGIDDLVEEGVALEGQCEATLQEAQTADS